MASNIILSSPTSITSDSETFYRDYWSPTGAEPSARKQLESRREFIIKHLMGNVTIGASILEIGVGGEGGIIAALLDSADVHGIDVSDSAITACRSIGIPVAKANCDQQSLPFENNRFDAVIALEVFEHFANPQFALEEIRRVLKPLGQLIVSVPSIHSHHWPRLFYPALFERANFHDFMLANRFMPTLHDDPLFNNSYADHLNLSSSEKSFSFYWQAIRLDERDLKSLHTTGKELFARRDSYGIRIRPIEALELFKHCMDLGPISLELETDYLCALFYRVINGDTKEFTEHLGALMDRLTSPEDRVPYARAILLVHHEADQLGRSFLDKTYLQTLTSILATT